MQFTIDKVYLTVVATVKFNIGSFPVVQEVCIAKQLCAAGDAQVFDTEHTSGFCCGPALRHFVQVFPE